MTRKELLYAALALAGGFIGGVVGLRLSVVASAAATAIPKSVAAEELRLVDQSGRTEAALTASKGEPNFSMYDHSGKLRAELSLGSEQELGFKLYDSKGAMRISLSVSPEGISAMRLFDSSVRPRALLGVDNEGEPALDFYTGNGRLMRELP